MPAKSTSYASTSKQPRGRPPVASASRSNGGPAASTNPIEVDSEGDDDEDDDEVEEGEGEYVIEAILKNRYNKKTGVDELLVRWEGYGPEDDTWEPEANIRETANDMVNTFWATKPHPRQTEKREAERIKEAQERKARRKAGKQAQAQARRETSDSSSSNEASEAVGLEAARKAQRNGRLDKYFKPQLTATATEGMDEDDEEEEEEEVAALANVQDASVRGGLALRIEMNKLETWSNKGVKIFTIVPIEEVPTFDELFPQSTEKQFLAWIQFKGHNHKLLYPLEDLREKAPQVVIDFLVTNLKFS
ncbi:hypothetical protein BDZ90DRAFT_262920 [Jaminaea rosea]|uniref:Chromo domain-containing protein n=1 Tax=Jaminaea rosea TaxID=1569628 RepID=A0A316UHL5_9BASI|nr:hypothetical protein BDZ90DRAFT_262920 [Jaminaea rosea]PWN24699.1 hypothetical protein BDZ90DRAFT_262920 [Jaminaea rosea]